MPDNDQQSVLSAVVELVDKATEPLHALSENFESFESGIWDISKAFGAAFVGYELFEQLTEPASEFQEEQVRLALATRASTEELARFKDQARELSETYPSTIDKVTAAQTELYNTFRNFDTMREGTEIADRLATVMRTDVTDATKILASATINLGDKNKTTLQSFQELSDKLTLLNTRYPAGSRGATTMARDFARLGASAHTYGIDINQIFALLGELNRMHIAGARGAGMFAQGIIHELAQVDEHGVNHLARYGLQIAKTREGHLNLIATLQNMSRMSPQALKVLEEHLPGQAQALSTLVDHMHDLTDAYEEFKNSSGSTADAVTAQSATYQNQMTLFQNSVKNLKEQLGLLALPEMTKLVNNMHQLITEVTNFGEAHPHFTKIVVDLMGMAAALIAVTGAVGFLTKLVTFGLRFGGVIAIVAEAWSMLMNLIAAGALVAEMGLAALGPALTMAFESNPVGWIITALALIAFASYEIWKHWDDIKATVLEVGDALKGLWSEMKGLGFWGTVKTALPDLLQGNVSGAIINLTTAGANTLGSSGNTEVHVHYMEGGTIQVGQDGLPALHNELQQHSRDLGAVFDDVMHNDRRRSFGDVTNPFAFGH